MSEEKLKDLESKVEKLERIAKSEILKSMSDKLKAIDLESEHDYSSMDIDTLSAFRDMVSEVVDAAIAKFDKKDDIETETDSVELNQTQETHDDLQDVNIVAELSEEDVKDEAEAAPDNAEADNAEADNAGPAETDNEETDNTDR